MWWEGDGGSTTKSVAGISGKKAAQPKTVQAAPSWWYKSYNPQPKAQPQQIKRATAPPPPPKVISTGAAAAAPQQLQATYAPANYLSTATPFSTGQAPYSGQGTYMPNAYQQQQSPPSWNAGTMNPGQYLVGAQAYNALTKMGQQQSQQNYPINGYPNMWNQQAQQAQQQGSIYQGHGLTSMNPNAAPYGAEPRYNPGQYDWNFPNLVSSYYVPIPSSFKTPPPTQPPDGGGGGGGYGYSPYPSYGGGGYGSSNPIYRFYLNNSFWKI